MTETYPPGSLEKLYKLTGLFGLLGFIAYFWLEGVRSASAFALGAACSIGNVWLFDRMSRSIAPGPTGKKPLQPGAYIIRYILLLGIGYGIVKALDVSPLAVVLGLLSSAAAVLASLILEIISHVISRRTSH
jgi:hypothetical protein